MTKAEPFPVPLPARRLEPAHWLVVSLVGLLMGAAVLANAWGVRQRALGRADLTSGGPDFEVTALADPRGELALADILGRPDAFTAPVPGRIHPSFVWYRLAITNHSSLKRPAVIGLDNGYLNEATLYQDRGALPPLIETTGTSLRWADRAVPGVKLGFPVDLSPRRQSVFYVRVHDPTKQPDRFFLWFNVAAFRHLTDLYELEYACYYALWFGLFIYNAFLYAVLRRRDYLFYVLYLLASAAFMVTASGASTIVVAWPIWPLRGVVAITLLNLTTFSLVRFSRVFLDTPAQLPRADRWLNRAGWTLIAIAAGVPALFWQTASIGYEPIVLLGNIAVLAVLPVIGALLYFRRTPQAGVYVLAFLPLAGSFVYSLQNIFGRIPDASANLMPALTGSALELILLALALAWRYRQITDEADRLREEHTSRLERAVALQTRELRETHDSLAAANRDKDRVFSILGHDLRGPSQMLSGLSRELAAAPDSLTDSERAKLAAEIEEACQAQLELLDNLLLWGRTQSGTVPLPAQPAEAADIVQAATGALAQAARRKGLRLVAKVELGLVVLADPKAAEVILRNLIGNAIKFTNAGGMITVRGARLGDHAEITVSDTGVGIPAERFGELLARPVQSQDGTSAEKGSGVGLTLCRDLARGNGGELRISSELHKGTTAVLTLPAGVASVLPKAAIP